MSSDEHIEPRVESETNDVEAHKYVTEEPRDDNVEDERKQYEEPADPDGDDFGRRPK